MTDRINALTVVLGKDTREDDIDSLCEAILHLRSDVKKNVVDINSTIAESRARQAIAAKLAEVLQ